MAQDTKPAPAAAAEALPPQPKVIEGAAEAVDNHALPKATADHAGAYRITHGNVRIGDKFYGVGSILQLGADDGKNFSDAGVAERVEE